MAVNVMKPTAQHVNVVKGIVIVFTVNTVERHTIVIPIFVLTAIPAQIIVVVGRNKMRMDYTRIMPAVLRKPTITTITPRINDYLA